jgi:hypothetical protein
MPRIDKCVIAAVERVIDRQDQDRVDPTGGGGSRRPHLQRSRNDRRRLLGLANQWTYSVGGG